MLSSQVSKNIRATSAVALIPGVPTPAFTNQVPDQ
jgi:hypothetical protein